MISDSQEIAGMEAFMGDDDRAAGYDSSRMEYDPDDNYGGTGPVGGGVVPADGLAPEYTESGYGLCNNDTLMNLTYKSLFCDYNYSHPIIPLNVSGKKFQFVVFL